MMKFVWSDYLVARLMGWASKGLVKLSGGKFASTGEFLAAQSRWWPKFVNKGAAIFTLSTSATGISEAYGKMVFDQVQRQAYNDIMRKVDADVEKIVDV